EQAADQDRPLIGGTPLVGGHPPVVEHVAVAEEPEDGVGVADVGTEERHRRSFGVPAGVGAKRAAWWGDRSRPMSKTLTEWVSAPTEMKSTPVSATSLARSNVSPPDASSEARPAVIRTASAIASLLMLSSRIRAQPASRSSRSWSRSVTSTSTGRSG